MQRQKPKVDLGILRKTILGDMMEMELKILNSSSNPIFNGLKKRVKMPGDYSEISEVDKLIKEINGLLSNQFLDDESFKLLYNYREFVAMRRAVLSVLPDYRLLDRTPRQNNEEFFSNLEAIEKSVNAKATAKASFMFHHRELEQDRSAFKSKIAEIDRQIKSYNADDEQTSSYQSLLEKVENEEIKYLYQSEKDLADVQRRVESLRPMLSVKLPSLDSHLEAFPFLNRGRLDALYANIEGFKNQFNDDFFAMDKDGSIDSNRKDRDRLNGDGLRDKIASINALIEKHYKIWFVGASLTDIRKPTPPQQRQAGEDQDFYIKSRMHKMTMASSSAAASPVAIPIQVMERDKQSIHESLRAKFEDEIYTLFMVNVIPEPKKQVPGFRIEAEPMELPVEKARELYADALRQYQFISEILTIIKAYEDKSNLVTKVFLGEQIATTKTLHDHITNGGFSSGIINNLRKELKRPPSSSFMGFFSPNNTSQPLRDQLIACFATYDASIKPGSVPSRRI